MAVNWWDELPSAEKPRKWWDDIPGSAPRPLVETDPSAGTSTQFDIAPSLIFDEKYPAWQPGLDPRHPGVPEQTQEDVWAARPGAPGGFLQGSFDMVRGSATGGLGGLLNAGIEEARDFGGALFAIPEAARQQALNTDPIKIRRLRDQGKDSQADYIERIQAASNQGPVIDQILEPAEGLGQSLTEMAGGYFDAVEENRPDNPVANWFYDVSTNVARMGPQLAFAAVTRSPNAGLAMMSGDIFGNEYNRAIEEGKTHDEAMIEGGIAAVYEVAPEKAFGVFERFLQPGAFNRVRQALAEGGTEATTSALTIMDEAWRQGEAVGSPMEIAQRVMYEASIGAGMGAIIGPGGRAPVAEEAPPTPPPSLDPARQYGIPINEALQSVTPINPLSQAIGNAVEAGLPPSVAGLLDQADPDFQAGFLEASAELDPLDARIEQQAPQLPEDPMAAHQQQAQQRADEIGQMLQPEAIEQAQPEATEQAESTQVTDSIEQNQLGNSLPQLTDTVSREQLPPNFDDPRLMRGDYRQPLQAMLKDLRKGGEVTYLDNPDAGFTNARGEQVAGPGDKIRTPSTNPEWFKSLGQNLFMDKPLSQRKKGNDKSSALTVEQVNRAVNRALSGKKLGSTQVKIIDAMMTEIQGGRTEVDNQSGPTYETWQDMLKAYRNVRKEARAAERGEIVGAEADALAEAVDDQQQERLGHFYAAEEYAAEMDAESRALYDLYEQAAAESRDRANAILQGASSESETIQALYELIEQGRENAREQALPGSEGQGTQERRAQQRQSPEAPAAATETTETDLAGPRSAAQQAQFDADQARQQRTEASPDMLQGPGELFAGDRPEQTSLIPPKEAAPIEPVAETQPESEPAETQPTDFGAQWDAMSADERTEIAKRAKWVVKSGDRLNPTGRGIIKRDWADQSEGTRAILERNARPEAQPESQSQPETTQPSRDAVIAESKASGARHMDDVTPAVETMRAYTIEYVHDPKQRGVIDTVDTDGNAYVLWLDDYSRSRNGEILIPSDFQDYVITNEPRLNVRQLRVLRRQDQERAQTADAAEESARQEQAQADVGAIEAEAREMRPLVDRAEREGTPEQRAALQDYVDGNIEASEFRAAMEAEAQPEPEPEAPVEQAEPTGTVEAYGDDSLDLRRPGDLMRSMDKELTDDEISGLPLSKIWPKSEVDAIEDVKTAAFMTAVRSHIPNKPRQKHKKARWVEEVKIARQLAQMYQEGGAEAIEEKMKTPRFASSLGPVFNQFLAMQSLPRDQWSRIGPIDVYPDAYRYGENREKVPSPFVSVKIDKRNRTVRNVKTLDEAIPKIREMLGAEQQTRPTDQYEVRGRTGGPYSINRKTDPERTKLITFDKSREAFDYIQNNPEELEALWQKVKDGANVKKADVRRAENRERVGKNHRGDRDVTSEEFVREFGLRHVDFGNWVNQGKGRQQRQKMLNQAYDALMDLSDILSVPSRAIGLDGQLIVTLGKRGTGWANAHFEPGLFLINLTKTRGAGSLAHEWFHALDNYFQKQRGPTGADREGSYITYRPEPLMRNKQYPRSKLTRAELRRRHNQSPDREYFKPQNWEKDPNHPEGVRPVVERAFTDLVDALNDSPMKGRALAADKGKSGYWSRIIERAARSFENYVIHRMRQEGFENDFLSNVAAADEFVRDDSRYPYLLQSEMEPIVNAFDNLFNTIETRQTDTGVAMYSMGETVNVPRRTWQWMGFDGPQNLVADFGQLAAKHSEYYSSPDSVQSDVEYVLEAPENWFVHAPGRVSVVRAMEGSNLVPSVRIDFRLDRNGNLRVASVYRMPLRQALRKIREARPGPDNQQESAESPGAATIRDYLEAEADRSSLPDSSSDESSPPMSSIARPNDRAQGGQSATPESFRSALGRRTHRALTESGLMQFVDGMDSVPGNHPANAAAVYVDGTAYINTRMVAEGAETGLVLHEIGVHEGLKRFIGEDTYDRLSRRLIRQAERGQLDGASRADRETWEAYRKAQVSARASADYYLAQTGREMSEQQYNDILTEETWAYMAQNGADSNLWQRFVSAIKAALTRMGLSPKWINGLTNSDIAALARGSVARVVDQVAESQASIAPAMYQAAYHGTPYLFDRFSLSKIGTGEGAQAYGWGLYFAGRRAVAEFYAGSVVDQSWLGGINAEMSRLAKIMAADQTGEWGKYRTDAGREAKAKYDRLMDERSAGREGNLFQADIPENDVLLDWDKPLSEQPEKVRDALDSADFSDDPVIPRWKENGAWDRITGENLYRHLSGGLTVRAHQDGKHREASMRLGAIGIPGLRYLDGSSRIGSLRSVSEEFSQVLPDDATPDQVIDAIDQFSTPVQSLLQTLHAGNWMGMTPAEAVRPRVLLRPKRFGASSEIAAAIKSSLTGGTSNFVIWDENAVTIEAINDQVMQAETLRYSKNFDALDTQHREAVESGDMETAKRLVDEAARAAGYETRAWHGTRNGEFTRFRPGQAQAGEGIFLSDNRAVTEEFGQPQEYLIRGRFATDADWRAAAAELEAESQAEIDALDDMDLSDEEYLDRRDELERDAFRADETDNAAQNAQISRRLQEQGFDGHAGPNQSGDGGTEYIVFSPENVKSAEAATYDDNGNLIPLSERFNRASGDIRYSVGNVYEWADRESAPVGAWVKEPYTLDTGQPVLQVQDLDVNDLRLSELDEQGNLDPTKRRFMPEYTERARAGERPPMIRVIEMEDGRMSVTDGHRRVLAAREAGQDTIRALVSPLIETADGKREPTLADVQGGDVRYSMQGTLTGGTFGEWTMPTRDQRESARSEANGRLQALLKTTKRRFRKGRIIFQDKLLPVKEAVEAARKMGTVTEFTEVYKRAENAIGKTGDRMDRLEEKQIMPLVDKMREYGVSQDDLGDYLYARHAKERNRQIAQINDAFADTEKTPGSGMADSESDRILGQYRGSKARRMQELAGLVDKITRQTKQTLVDSGLIDKEMADAWDKTYKHYVPLKGLEGDTDTFESAGRGFDTRGKEVQRALGRRSQAKDILAQIIADAQRAIIRSEKNQVGKSLLLLALDNPNPGLWEVTPVESNRKVDPASGKVVYTHNPKWHGDDIFIVKSKGKSYAIQLDPQLAKAMKNLGGETMNTALSYLAKLNRWLSYANTALNPEFVITNFFRDFEQSLIQLAGEHGTALAKAVASDVKGMGPMMGAFHELSGDGLSSKMTEVVGRGRAREWSDWFKKYRASGGKISYFRQESIPEQVNRINNLMRQAERTPGAYGRRMFKEAVGLIENLNGAVENAVRVATYKNAIEQGYTETEAAHMSRDLTVNFNRRGEAGVLMNSLYLFYNAAIQGNYRALSAMSNKRVQKIMGTAMVGQAMLTILNYMLAGDDEDGESLYEKIPDYEKSRNLIIMTPGGEPIKIPMPYVYSAFMSLPENIVGVAFGRKPSKATANVFHAFAESVNPLHDRNWLLMAAPTIADPFIEVWENRNFFGSPIRPESPYEDYVRPDSDKYWASVNPAALKAGKALNRITGGSDTTAGLVDISPESIEHFVEHFTGAAGAFVMRTHSFVDDPATAFSENKAPLLRKLYGANTKFYAQDQYKAAAEQIEAVQTAMDRIEREDFDEFSDFAEARRRFRGENEDILRLAPRYEATEKRLRQLYKQRREVMENKRIDEEKKEERLQEIEDRIDQARIRFNRRFNETFRQTGLG